MNQPVNLEEMLKKASEGQSLAWTLVCLKDLARGRFHASRAVSSLREATRDFKTLCESDPMISKNKQDFELYHVGIFDPVTGAHHGIPPVLLHRAVDFPTPVST